MTDYMQTERRMRSAIVLNPFARMTLVCTVHAAAAATATDDAVVVDNDAAAAAPALLCCLA